MIVSHLVAIPATPTEHPNLCDIKLPGTITPNNVFGNIASSIADYDPEASALHARRNWNMITVIAFMKKHLSRAQLEQEVTFVGWHFPCHHETRLPFEIEELAGFDSL